MKTETGLLAFVGFIVLTLASQSLGAPTQLIRPGDVWKYLDDGSDQGTAWRSETFDDSHWSSGVAQFGYGDGDEATQISFGPNPSAKYITTYFRKAFILGDFVTVSNAVLRLLRDDGAVVYINGVEAFRSNMPEGPITSATTAVLSVCCADETTNFHSAALPAELLHFGLNVVAVEIHQQSGVSGDISFDFELWAEINHISPVPQVTVTAVDHNASEINPLLDRPDDPGVFRIARTGPVETALLVNVSLTGTAQNGVDYSFISNRVEVPAGASSVDVYVSVLDDTQAEGVESVQLNVLWPNCNSTSAPPPGCYAVGNPGTAMVAILDDDESSNVPPTVRITTPEDGAVFAAPANIFINSSPSDLNGYDSIQTVEYFEGTRSLGIRTNYPVMNPIGPFALTWSGVPLGQYTLRAVATDDHGARGTSAPVRVTVQSTQEPPATVTFIAKGSVWKYLDDGSDQGTAWRAPGFNDTAWASGPAQLGYGDGDEATVVSYGPDPFNKYVTTYFRRSFNVTDATAVQRLAGKLRQDDGGVVYLNGVEIFRANLPAGPIFFNTFAPMAVEDQILDFSASGSLLVNGQNIIAVEMHQVNAASSDLSFDLALFVDSGGGTNTGPPGVGVFAADAWATETQSSNGALDVGIFRFWREGATGEPLTVFYSLGGDAGNGIDYATLANSVTIPAGSSVADVIVSAIDDEVIEPTETVVLNLVSNAAYRVGTSNNPAAIRGTVHIIDNDPTEPNHAPSIRLIRPADGDVFYTPANIQLAAFAEDLEDQHALQVEFFADGQRLGLGQFIPGACITCPYYTLTWSNVPPGRHTITARATDSGGAITTSDAITITVSDGSSVDRELHAVSVYSGDVNGSYSQNHETGSVSVEVNRPGKHVTLFLGSYEPVVWNVAAVENTTIERVILGSYYVQTVTGLAPGVQIINGFYEANTDYIDMGYTSNSVRFYRGLAKLCDLTGLNLGSFQGAYHSAGFVVDTVVNDERLRCDYPQPVDPAQLPELSFRVSFYDHGLFHQNYTLAGPQDASRLLPAMRVVADVSGRYYYGTESHAVWRLDSDTGVLTGMNLGDGIPELSWPTGIAFDSQRNRVLLSSLGGEGFLYGYSPAQDAWSLISSLNNIDTSGLGYHLPNDSIYAVASTYEDYHPRVLHRFQHDGQRVGQIQLPIMPFDFGPGGYETELVSVGEYLVLLVEPNSAYFHGNGPRESRIYRIDPRNGEVLLTYRRVLVSDTDRDGVPDDRDLCPFTGTGTPVDASGCPLNASDSDGDGVADARDVCPGTPPGSIVNVQGCSLAQLCPCDGSWTNHAGYVNCVIRHAWEFYRQGLITADDRRTTISEAVMSSCGRTADEPLSMHLMPQSTEECQRDGLAFILTGDIVGSCIVECSSDLINWAPVQTDPVTIGEEILCPVPESGARFYRLRLAP